MTEPSKPADRPPKSPCISVCVLDDNDVCTGCYRTGEEIMNWFMADDGEKRAILAACSQRRAAASRVRLL